MVVSRSPAPDRQRKRGAAEQGFGEVDWSDEEDLDRRQLHENVYLLGGRLQRVERSCYVNQEVSAGLAGFDGNRFEDIEQVNQKLRSVRSAIFTLSGKYEQQARDFSQNLQSLYYLVL